ncbi:MAG: MBOAT family protein, partial [Bacteroidetes bacterium]|nr:MBOAT family protein [Bacteroidota bacterium]
YERHTFRYNDAVSGLRMMLWGLFKKVVIADRLALLTDPVFNHPHDYPALTLVIATIFFTYQIYCDFSGYSDIAIGSARVMGFKLMRNFNRPYAAESISEFWSRWHISLSTWFRDYLYIPLGGNRVAVPRWFFNLFFVFLVSGFWHGANWTFLIWGMLHGTYLIVAIVKDKAKEKYMGAKPDKNKPVSVVDVGITFALAAVAWVFFRANTVTDACYIIGRLPYAISDVWHIVRAHDISFLKIWKIQQFDSVLKLAGTFALIAFLEASQYIQEHYKFLSQLAVRPFYYRWAIYYTLIFIILFFGVFENRQFIYFQF